MDDTRVVGVPDDRFTFGFWVLSAHLWRAVGRRLVLQSADLAVWVNHVARALVH